MSRDVTVAFATALADQSLRPVIFFEGQFASGWVRLWSGLGEITWNGKAWSGAGTLLGLGSIEETGEVVAGGTAISLSGVPLDLVQMAIAEARQEGSGLAYAVKTAVSLPIRFRPSLGVLMSPKSRMMPTAARSPSAMKAV
jgi:hypothetical protein